MSNNNTSTTLSPATLSTLRTLADGAEHEHTAACFKLVREGLAVVVFDNGPVPPECQRVTTVRISDKGRAFLAAL